MAKTRSDGTVPSKTLTEFHGASANPAHVLAFSMLWMFVSSVSVGSAMKSTKTSADKTPAWDEALVFAKPDLSKMMALSLVNNSGTSQKI